MRPSDRRKGTIGCHLLVTVFLVVLLGACGVTEQDHQAGDDSEVFHEKDAQDDQTIFGKSNTDTSIFSGSEFDGYDDSFDVYKDYEPDSRIMNLSLADGAYVQIGDHVLELGKSTVRDFMNAGADFYNSKAEFGSYYGHPSRDRELNEKCLQDYLNEYKKDGTVIFPCFLSGWIRLDLSSFGRTLIDEDPEDPIVDSVMFENYAGNIENPETYLYGEPDYKDIRSIYVTGGIRFTGPVSTIPETYGKAEIDEHGEKDGHQYWSRVFTADSPDPDYTYYCQVLSRNDHCSSLYLKLKDSPNRPIVRDDTILDILKSHTIFKLSEMGDTNPSETVDDYFSYQIVRSQKETEEGNRRYLYYANIYVYRTFSETVLVSPYGDVYELYEDRKMFEKYKDYFSFDITDFSKSGQMLHDPTYQEGGYDFEDASEQEQENNALTEENNLSKWPGLYVLEDDENYRIDVLDTYTDGTIYFGMYVLDASGTHVIYNEYNVAFSDPEMTEFSIPYQGDANEVFRLVDDGIIVSLDMDVRGVNDGFYKRTLSY